MKFSLIVPVYNTEKYLNKCIDSLLNQNFDDYEVILVNDGSTDSSLQIMKQYENIEKIKIYTKENGGLSDTRNFGLQKANGDYVWFIDSDDYIDNNALKIINKNLNNDNIDILCFNYYSVVENIPSKQIIKNVSNEYLTFNPSACFKVIKRKFLQANNIHFYNHYYEDLETCSLMRLYTNNIKYIEEALYYYINNPNSFLHSNVFNNRKDDIYLVLNNIREQFKSEFIEEIEFIHIYHLLYKFSCNLLLYNREIYKTRIMTNIKLIDDLYKNWKNNRYYKNLSAKDKLIIYLIKNKHFSLLSIIYKLKIMLRRK